MKLDEVLFASLIFVPQFLLLYRESFLSVFFFLYFLKNFFFPCGWHKLPDLHLEEDKVGDPCPEVHSVVFLLPIDNSHGLFKSKSSSCSVKSPAFYMYSCYHLNSYAYL